MLCFADRHRHIVTYIQCRDIPCGVWPEASLKNSMNVFDALLTCEGRTSGPRNRGPCRSLARADAQLTEQAKQEKPMRNQRPAPRERTAYHEAGHAVVGHLLGWQVSYISIQDHTSYHGYTAFMEPRPPHGHAIPLGVVTFDLATGPQHTEEDLPDLLTRGLAGIPHFAVCGNAILEYS